MMRSESNILDAPAGVSRPMNLLWPAVAVLLLLAGIWAWAAGLTGPYHFDDYVTPLNDPASQSFTAFGEYLPVTLRPLSKLSYVLEAEAGWTIEPAPRRVASLLLHAISAGVMLLLIARLAPASTPLVAGFLAALWFIHPVHADSVLMLSGRTAVLSGLFLLTALLALERSQRWLAALLFVLACLSRETALAGLLPLAVLAASRPGASIRSMVREITPVLLGGALVLVWIMTTPRYMHLAEYSFLGRPFWSSFASQVGAVPVGLGLLFNPAALSIDYGIPLPARISDPRCLLGLGLYASAMAGIFLLRKRSRAAAVGLALWLAALLPTQSVVPKLDALSNRPLALALAGLLLIAAPLVGAAVRRLGGSWTSRYQQRTGTTGLGKLRLATSLAAAAMLVMLANATANRAALFQSELSLWQDAAGKSRTNVRPHLQHATLLKRAGRSRDAYQASLAAQAIDPFSSQVALLVRSYRPEGESQ
jgi:hypothetical protein